MLNKILLILLLVSITAQECSKGCQRCEKNGQCVISDIFNNYTLKAGSPLFLEIDKCTMLDFNSKCRACGTFSFLDDSGNGCVIVPENGQVANCQLYNQVNVCSFCNEGYVLNANTCQLVEKKINNCKDYLSLEQCLECDSEYVLSWDWKKCIPNPKKPNCAAYSYVECKDCATDFARIPNQYLSRFDLPSDPANYITYTIRFGLYQTNNNLVHPNLMCQAATVTNCLEFEKDVNKCIKCQPGHFLTTPDNRCEAFPNGQIKNCKVYGSVSTCEECVEGYYFENKVCTEIPTDKLVTNCIKYDSTASSIKCLECSINFYLNSNSCVDRTKSKDNLIVNCKTKSLINDKCATCNESHLLSSDGLACKKAVDNCETHNVFNAESAVKCEKCKETFYLRENADTSGSLPPTECKIGNIDKCGVYLTNKPDSCVTCINGFVFETDKCVESNRINDCDTYNSTNKTLCTSCNKSNSYNFLINKKCGTIENPVQHCAVHEGGSSATPTCTKCIDGYEKNGNICQEVTIDKCIRTNLASLCLECEKDYALSRDSLSCKEPLAYMTEKCDINSTIDESNDELVKDVTCSQCKLNSYPINVKDHFVCIANTDLTQIASTGFISDCIKYDSSLSCLQCNPGSVNKYLKANACVSGCGDNGAKGEYSKIVLEKATTTSDYEIVKWNVCVTANTIEGCLARAPDLSNTNLDPICLSCRDTHMPVVSLTETAYSVVSGCPNIPFPYIEGPLMKYPQVTCVTRSGKTVNALQNINIDGMRYFKSVSGTNYTALRCRHTFMGTPDTNGFLTNCVQDTTNCQNKKLFNIGLYWESLFSCVWCKDDTKIPFIAYDITDNNTPDFTKWAPWDTTASGGSYGNSNGTKKNIVCLDNSASSFGIVNQNDYGVDQFCALGVLFTNATAATDYDAGTPTYQTSCAACKPGYKKTASSVSHLVKSCTAIENCSKKGNIANGCEICNDGFILKYENNNIVFDDVANTCISIPVPKLTKMTNCLAATLQNGSAKTAEECAICKRGFHLNKDKYCEKISVANCKVDRFRVSNKLPKPTLEWSLYLQAQGIGCTECESNFSAVQIAAQHSVCIGSSWVETHLSNSTEGDTSQYIPNCKGYDASQTDSLVCKECNVGFVIKGTAGSPDGKKCFPSATLSNCAIAASSEICAQCVEKKFGILNNTCIQGNEEHCAEYNYNANSNKVSCNACEAGYYLDGNKKCLSGQIKNCTKFKDNQPSACDVCDNGFEKVIIKGNGTYCYPIATDLNCSSFDSSNSTNGGSLTCTSCSSPSTNMVMDLDPAENHTICMPFVQIEECTAYDIGADLNSTSFNCIACKDEFFNDVASNSCLERTNKDTNCSEYNPKKDECVVCVNNTFLSTDKKKCDAYPIGIIGCVEYSSLDVCIGCGDGRYLSGGECLLADPGIENCLRYTSNTVCSVCKPGYMFINELCEKANALNCLTYQSLDDCATCADLDGLVSEDGKTNCRRQDVLNCLKIKDQEPYPCEQCFNNFYLEDGKCKSPDPIANCIVFESKTACAKCGVGFALSADKDLCVNEGELAKYIDPNCVDSFIPDQPVCSICQGGYHFKNDACVAKCSDPDGCYHCDTEDPATCVICKLGYYMDENGKCNENNPKEPDSIGIRGIMGLLSLIALLVVSK